MDEILFLNLKIYINLIKSELVDSLDARLERLIADRHHTVDVLIVSEQVSNLDELNFDLPTGKTRTGAGI